MEMEIVARFRHSGRTVKLCVSRIPTSAPAWLRMLSLGYWLCLGYGGTVVSAEGGPRGAEFPGAGTDVVSIASAEADDYLVEVWDTDRGLPHSSITGLAQTRDGYLWVGTMHGGLARFDGVRFVTFHPGNTPPLKSIEIHGLTTDAEGTLWIGTAEGALVSLRGGEFSIELQSPETPASWFRNVIACQDGEVVLSTYGGQVFRGTQQGVSNVWETVVLPDSGVACQPCVDHEGSVWYLTSRLQPARLSRGPAGHGVVTNGLGGVSVNALAVDLQGRIWAGTGKGLAVWNGAQFTSRLPTNDGPAVVVQQIAFTAEDSIWVRSPGRLRKFRQGGWVAEAAGWPIDKDQPVGAEELHADAEGGVWLVNYAHGLWHVDATGRTVRIGPEQGLPKGVPKCWLQDREGNVWVGLTDGGLARIRKATFHTVWPADAASERTVRSVCEDARGAMWFGTAGNSFLRWQAGKFTTFVPPSTNAVGREITVCPDAQARLWVGTVQNGVVVFERERFMRPFESEDIGTVARALFTDHAGTMWIGSEFGLFAWRSGKLKRFTIGDGFPPAYVLAITEDRAGVLWIGTAVGELRRLKEGRFTRYRPEDSTTMEAPLLPVTEVDPLAARGRGTLSGGERFWALHADAEGVIWIGSLGGGLLRFQDGRFTRFTTQDGLPSEHVSQILEDDRGQLWLGTRGGILRVDKARLNAVARGAERTIAGVAYGRSDGLPTVECSGGSQPGCWHGRDGRLWFATVKGAAWVKPGEVPFNPLPPPVVIEEILVDGQRLDGEEFDGSPPAGRGARFIQTAAKAPGRARIAAGRHYFEFKFTALSFTSPDKVRFAWQLAGLESDWVTGSPERAVSYSYIPPGEYRFRVRACNNDGVWNNQPAELQLTVLPYFWQTGWFRVLLAGAAAAVLLALYRLKVARLRAMQRLRLRIARDLHDDVGANLGSISLLAQVMRKKPTSEDASLIQDITAQTVDTLRDIVWFIDPAHERLSDLVVRLHETAKTLLAGIPFQFEQSGDFSSEQLPMDFRRNALPLFKEALHNIVKHAGAGNVRITVSRRANRFEVQICDDGVGFDPQARYCGNGLKNLQRRAREMRGELAITSRVGGGTTITLTARIT